MSKRDLPKADLPAKTGAQPDLPQTAMNRWNSSLSASIAQDEERSISVLDPIGAGWYYEGVTAKRIAAALQGMGDGPVTVNINSPGGDFFEGLAIYNLLREHSGKVTVKVLGIAASAASAIAMAGDEVLIARAGFFMIHNTQVCACGDRHGLSEVSDWLTPFDTALVDIYAARTGLDGKALAKMLDKETWIAGMSAVDQGFADDLLPSDQVASTNEDDAGAKAYGAQVRIDALLAKANVSRSERRSMIAALRGGTPGAASSGTLRAAEHGTQDAAIFQGAAALLAKMS